MRQLQSLCVCRCALKLLFSKDWLLPTGAYILFPIVLLGSCCRDFLEGLEYADSAYETSRACRMLDTLLA